MRYNTNRYTTINTITSENPNYLKENMFNGSVLEQWRSTDTTTQTITFSLTGEDYYNLIALINCNANTIQITTQSTSPLLVINDGTNAIEPLIINDGTGAIEPLVINDGGNAGTNQNTIEDINKIEQYFYDYRYTTFDINQVRNITITLSGGTNDGNDYYKIGELYISQLSDDIKTEAKAIQKSIIDNSSSVISSGNISIVDPSYWYRQFQISTAARGRENIIPLLERVRGNSQVTKLWVVGSSDSCYGDEILLGVLDSPKMQIEHIDISGQKSIEKVVYGLKETFGGFENVIS